MSEQSLTMEDGKLTSPLKTVFRTPAFVTLWLSEGLSMVGDRLLMVALISLVYDRTGSAGAVGLLMVFKAVPALLLGSLAGVFCGSMGSQMDHGDGQPAAGSAGFSGSLFAPGLTVICAIYFAMSAVNQFFMPARSSAIPDLVPASALLAANSLFAMAIVFAMAPGPCSGDSGDGEFLGVTRLFSWMAFSFLIPAAARRVPGYSAPDANG